jgi:molybdopterin-guanine dinucleotide biosynthesis protein B
MKVCGFVGDSGSGKTTLIEALVARLHGQGLRLATVKHAHHGFDMDVPGKDTWRFREAGAAQVLVASARRWALLGEEALPEGPGSGLRLQLARLAPADVVLVEGFRGEAGTAYIEVRRDPAAPPRPREGLVARAHPGGLRWEGPQDPALPVLDLDDVASIAEFVLALPEYRRC